MALVLADAHVHVFSPDAWPGLLTAARGHFRAHAATLGLVGEQAHFLCLAEIAGCNFFRQLRDTADADRAGDGGVRPTDEPESLAWREPGEAPLYVVAGRQIVSAEGLEILALGLTGAGPDQCEPAERLVAELLKKPVLVVLPWGVGKWLGRRGMLVRRLTARFGDERRFFLGDNGNRPWCWPLPKPFAEFGPARNLPGSDPLRLPGQERRVGCIGLCGQGEVDEARPFHSFKNLAASGKLRPCGSPQKLPAFLHTQLALRLRRRE